MKSLFLLVSVTLVSHIQGAAKTPSKPFLAAAATAPQKRVRLTGATQALTLRDGKPVERDDIFDLDLDLSGPDINISPGPLFYISDDEDGTSLAEEYEEIKRKRKAGQ